MKETTERVDSKYKWYLYELGETIRARALEAKTRRAASKRSSAQYEYDTAFLLAYNSVVSLMQQLAEGFDIPPEDLQLEGIDPDKELV